MYAYAMTDLAFTILFKGILKKNGIIVHCILFVLPDGPSALHPAELSLAILLF